ncbi:S-layer homology domain-containing protein [Candidatus Peregrinibacteria bacterium]|nr:S-layer homology domain-containing protein [Candidatus Peregrinibacteria bacterium]
MKKAFALISFLLFSTTTYALSDISNDPHRDAIEYLQSQDIVNGNPDGTFLPNKGINRAEVLKMIVLSANKNFDQSAYKNCFLDISNEWYAPYVCYAKAEGWVKGYNDNYFRPSKDVSKVEAIKMILEVHELTDNDNTKLPFSDVNDADWFAPYLKSAYEKELLIESSGNYQPGLAMTRSSTSETLYRILTGEKSKAPKEPIAENNNGTGSCAPLTNTIGTVINVTNVNELKDAIAQANSSDNTTILLADGTYTLDNGLWVDGDNIIIRSQSGNRDAVKIKGQGMNGGVPNVFWLAGDNITVADMTVGEVANHAIQVHGELDADNALLHNLHIIDTMEQLVKVSYDANQMQLSSDNGVLECSTLEYTAGIGPQYYIGGIDAHNAKNWLVKNNTFKNISSPEEDWAEHAVHFWSTSQDTRVENNTIINCDRGIGFGLGDRGHIGGMILNNTIINNNERGDVGIGLENASGVLVEGNTITLNHDYPNAIEYRFAGSKNITIKNNVTNKAIVSRDGGSAELINNTTN